MTEEEVECLAIQLLQGLGDLKSFAGIYHRDLKPDNIAVVDKNHYAIIDFGESQYIDQTNLKISLMKYVSLNNVKGKVYKMIYK